MLKRNQKLHLDFPVAENLQLQSTDTGDVSTNIACM